MTILMIRQKLVLMTRKVNKYRGLDQSELMNQGSLTIYQVTQIPKEIAKKVLKLKSAPFQQKPKRIRT